MPSPPRDPVAALTTDDIERLASIASNIQSTIEHGDGPFERDGRDVSYLRDLAARLRAHGSGVSEGEASDPEALTLTELVEQATECGYEVRLRRTQWEDRRGVYVEVGERKSLKVSANAISDDWAEALQTALAVATAKEARRG